MSRLKLFLDLKHTNSKLVLLYRFHIIAIFVNILAIVIDTYMMRYANTFIELSIISILLVNLYYLRNNTNLKISAYIFILSMSLALFLLIYINQFATMSVVFILLLPLTTLIFLEFKESLLLTTLLFVTMSSLLYFEHLHNPDNALAQNPQALFNLTYTALIIYIFGLFYHFSILKTFEELDTSNQQKALLLKEVHHRVKNNLNVIASIIGLQSNTVQGKEHEELLKSKSRIESIAIVHEMLYSHENFAQINFEKYMQRLTQLLLGMYASNKNIGIDIKSDTKELPLDVMVQLGIMVNELITNSIKYAFPNEKGTINMELYHDDTQYTFIYSDNGIGVKDCEKLLKSKSLGIKLIHLTAKQLKGTVHISSPKGLKYEVRFGFGT